MHYSSDYHILTQRKVTTGITAPSHKGFFVGLGTSFSLGATHRLEPGAVLTETTAVHVSVRHFGMPSVSTQIAVLRRLLLGPQEGAAGYWFNKVKEVSAIISIVSDLSSLRLFRVRYLLLWKPTVPISSRPWQS